MNVARTKRTSEPSALPKAPTGIIGFDEITFGGLPKGRPTLVAGEPGSGKTLFSSEFLVRGITQFDEPGVFMAFEETAEDLTKNVASLGFDLNDLVRRNKLAIDFVYVERSEIEETGEYDLEGLFVRLALAVQQVNAKRVVLDTVEALFSGFTNPSILRAELRRLFRWLKERDLTAVITAERGENTLTRYGLEEYVADAVIVLDHRVHDEISTRRLRVVKYRGSSHGTNEYPFLIGDRGISVLPITSIGLHHVVSSQRISSGVAGLDLMLGGRGYYRGSTILISGTAGTGKTTFAAHFAKKLCQDGGRCLYLPMEESPSQIVRNMHSIGLDLQPCLKKGLLRFEPMRSTLYGLEMHLLTIHRLVEEFKPDAVVLDPITNYLAIGAEADIKSLLTRVTDYLKSQRITTVMTSLTHGGETIEGSNAAVSSLVDTWILLRSVECSGERNRVAYVLKSRGMSHSNQLSEYTLSADGVRFIQPYIGPAGALTGSARVSREAIEQAQAAEASQQIDLKRRELDRKRRMLDAQIALLQARFEGEQQETEQAIAQQRTRADILQQDRRDIAKLRHIANHGREQPARAKSANKGKKK